MRSTLLVLSSLLALAACGGDGGTTPTPQPQPQPEPQQPVFAEPPEKAPREITPGVTVQGEALDAAGDVDVYAFTAPSASVVAVVVTVATSGQGVTVAVIDSATSRWSTSGTQDSGPVTAMFADVTPGRWLVRVHTSAAGTHGAYTLTIHTLNPQPESGDSVLPSGAWVAGALEAPYDVDDFVFDGVAGEEVNLFAEETDPNYIRYGPHLHLRGPSGGAWQVYLGRASGTIRLAETGRYRVRFVGDLPPGGGLPYRVQLYRINRAPETAAASLVSGRTASETLQMPGDVDEYTFTAAAGEFFRLNVGGGVKVTVQDAAGTPLALDFQRFTLPGAGTYTVTVVHWPGDPAPLEPLPYTLVLHRVDNGPEGVPATIAVGDTVSEALDPAGDIDEYTFTGTAGQEVVLLTEAPSYASVDLHRVDTGERLARVTSWRTEGGLGRHASQRIRLLNGQYRVRVWHDLASQVRRSTAVGTADVAPPAYRFAVHPISRGPETGPSAIEIGDTITGELRPQRDIDLYTFTAQAGEQLVLWGERVTNALPLEPLTMFVTRADAPEALAYVFPHGAGSHAFTAPATGTYRLVVWPAAAAGLQDAPIEDGDFVGTYRVAVRRAAP